MNIQVRDGLPYVTVTLLFGIDPTRRGARLRWQHGEWSAEDTAHAWNARGRDLAWIEEVVAARQMRAAAEEA